MPETTRRRIEFEFDPPCVLHDAARHVDHILMENVELTVKGNTEEELARSLVSELLERGLAREV